jgi:hypothetical protein
MIYVDEHDRRQTQKTLGVGVATPLVDLSSFVPPFSVQLR